MKPYHEIRQRLIEMNGTPHRDYLKTYGSFRTNGIDGMFNKPFLAGFTKALRHVLGEKLEEAEIRKNHDFIMKQGDENKILYGERNGYAWCLNFNKN